MGERQVAATKADTVLNTLKGATPQQIESWVDANVNNVADVKVMFKRILLAVLGRGVG